MIRFCIALICLSAGLAQTTVIRSFATNDTTLSAKMIEFPIDFANYSRILSDHLNALQDLGYLDSRIISRIQFQQQTHDSLKLDMITTVISGMRYRIDDVRFFGLAQVDRSDALRETRLTLGEPLNAELLNTTELWLQNSRFLSGADSITVVNDTAGTHVHLYVNETRPFLVDGIFGLRQDQNGDLTFTSDLRVEAENIAGTGRAIRFEWKQADERNEDLIVEYIEPRIFGWSLEQHLNFEKRLRDSIFTRWAVSTESRFRVSPQQEIGIAAGYGIVIPSDSVIAAQNQIPVSLEWTQRIRYRAWSLNRRFNPTSGWALDAVFDRQQIEYRRPASVVASFPSKRAELTRFEGTLRGYLPTFDDQVIYAQFVSRMQSGTGISSASDIFFGGFRSLRGFRENAFSARDLHLMQFEYRLVPDERNRFYVFADAAIFWRTNDDSYGKRSAVGIGFRIDTGVGILGVDYGFEADNWFTDGILHVGISSALTQ